MTEPSRSDARQPGRPLSDGRAPEGLRTDSARQIGIAVVWHEGKVLIGLRPEGMPLAGYWEFPGGKVESGESVAEAARRECREETGLEVRPVELYLTESFRYEHGSVELHFYRCVCLDPEPNPDSPYRWVPGHELAKYSFPDGNKRLLERLNGSEVGTRERTSGRNRSR